MRRSRNIERFRFDCDKNQQGGSRRERSFYRETRVRRHQQQAQPQQRRTGLSFCARFVTAMEVVTILLLSSLANKVSVNGRRTATKRERNFSLLLMPRVERTSARSGRCLLLKSSIHECPCALKRGPQEDFSHIEMPLVHRQRCCRRRRCRSSGRRYAIPLPQSNNITSITPTEQSVIRDVADNSSGNNNNIGKIQKSKTIRESQKINVGRRPIDLAVLSNYKRVIEGQSIILLRKY